MALPADGPAVTISAMNESENAIAEAEKAGFDLSLVDSNLRLTVEERMLRHDSALEFVLELRAIAANQPAKKHAISP